MDKKQVKMRKVAIICLSAAVVILAIAAVAQLYTIMSKSTREQEIHEEPKKETAGVAEPWYHGKQMIPSEQLGNDPSWKIVVNGKTSDEGFEDSTILERNLTDSDLAKMLSASFFVDESDGTVKELNYLKEPTVLEPEKIYTIEFDCTRYNILESIDRDTMRYYIVPLTVKAERETVITFAVYESNKRQFHQICIPFKVEKDMELAYSLDEVFEEETSGQVYRLQFKAEEKR